MMKGYCSTKPCRTLRLMTDEVETGSAATPKKIYNEENAMQQMTVGDVNVSRRENRVARKP